MVEWLLVLLGLLLVAACGVFVAAEFAFVTVDRGAVERAGAGGVDAALRTLSTQLSGAQVGITITNLAIGFLAEPSIAALLEGPLGALGLGDPAVTGVAVALALTLSTLITMLFGELVPKNIAISRPLGTAIAVAPLQRGFTRATLPLIRLLNGIANGILRRFGIEPQEELSSARAPEELVSLMRRSAQMGTLPGETAELLGRTLGLGRLTAADVMTPRSRLTVVNADDPVHTVLTATGRTGHSRFPVVGEDIDDIVGLVHAKHAVGVARDARTSVPIRSAMQPPVFIPGSVPADDLLPQLRREGLQLAVVVDEFGGTEGIVTLEDLIEEIVGEVADEHDRSQPAGLRRRPGGGWVLSGLLRPDEIREGTGVPVPDGPEYDTLGGYVTVRLGRLPRLGDEVLVVSTPADVDAEPVRFRLEVDRLDGRRVDRVLAIAEPAGGSAR
ncbi:hemolysin family protein [Cryptosporangium arvum]|uniref:CBS domain-containing protein n=1 Tax=Cryptosporangium arvum DSM 44712 TaxID=927661 RepID=A0A010Z334_9ACTN|nr:hemolysin family protein [Cryptosporangium arvum]EXG81818.1 CBS domain-containing protein [Cryptosporangium arvum DSM 44712]